MVVYERRWHIARSVSQEFFVLFFFFFFFFFYCFLWSSSLLVLGCDIVRLLRRAYDLKDDRCCFCFPIFVVFISFFFFFLFCLGGHNQGLFERNRADSDCGSVSAELWVAEGGAAQQARGGNAGQQGAAHDSRRHCQRQGRPQGLGARPHRGLHQLGPRLGQHQGAHTKAKQESSHFFFFFFFFFSKPMRLRKCWSASLFLFCSSVLSTFSCCAASPFPAMIFRF